MVWAHLLSMGSAMGNTFEFRDVMKASMKFGTDKSVEDVLFEQEQRRKERERETRRAPSGRPVKREVSTAAPRKSQMDLLNEMMKGVKPHLKVAAEVASPSDE